MSKVIKGGTVLTADRSYTADVKIDGVIIADEKKVIGIKDFKNNVFKLSYGKKKHYLVKII